ncbi:uroporphyrinogen-III synthase [Hyphomonas johnsonii]|uniref:Uroporphyrinogen-III synthase n=1 Tax=Hyphomonas johnsonii MHS-2 TaxID=1280950 RepID=A0A059FMC6_9PROT|nr:uroporphyrinogen-III synthase [Hyphomonas johnsonii]KCZ91598.1 uroporphyrinogen-III synthase [Hyphomonas johnsonii MHS-2]
MSLPVIVTRAEPGAAETAARLAALGYAPIVSPALVVESLPDAPLDMDGIDHLIFTSANGVRAFLARRAVGAETVWCVGDATAAAARQGGGKDVREGDGNAIALARLIIAAPEARTGGLLHVANDTPAGDLVAQLKAAGLDARFAALYRTVPVPALSAAATAALASGPAAVLVHSAKGAAAFRAAVAAAGLDLSGAVIAAISNAAAGPLAGCGAKAIIAAAHPSEAALMAALERGL